MTSDQTTKTIKKKKKIFGLFRGDFASNVQWKVAEPGEYRGLSQEDKKYLGKFNDEFLNGRIKKGDLEAIHKDSIDSGEVCNKGKSMSFYRSCKSNVNYQTVDLFGIKNSGKSSGLVSCSMATEEGGDECNILDNIPCPYTLSQNAIDAVLDFVHFRDFGEKKATKEQTERILIARGSDNKEMRND